jgi:hypothetical protein
MFHLQSLTNDVIRNSKASMQKHVPELHRRERQAGPLLLQ